MKKITAIALCLALTSCHHKNVKLSHDLDSNLTITKAWQQNTAKKLPFQTNANQALAYDDNFLYVLTNKGYITKLDKDSGKIIKKAKLNNKISSSMLLQDNKLYFTATNGKIFSLDTESLATNWQTEFNHKVVAKPAYHDNKLLLTTVDNIVVAVNAKSGEKIWQLSLSGNSLRLHTKTSIAVYNDVAYVGDAGGKVNAIDLATGSILWQKAISQNRGHVDILKINDVTTTPIVSNNKVFAAGFDNTLAALDAKSGELVWQKKLSIRSDLSNDNKAIYAITADNKIFAIYQETGVTKWQQKDLTLLDFRTIAASDNSLAVTDTKGDVFVLAKADGKLLALKKVANTPIVTNLLPHSKLSYILTDSKVVALSEK